MATNHFLVVTYTDNNPIEPWVGQQCLSTEEWAQQYAEGMKAEGTAKGRRYVTVTRPCSGSTCEVL